MFQFIRNIYRHNLKTTSYSLNNVAGELLNNNKHDVDISKLSYLWDNNPDKLEIFCEYNLNDADLALQLCNKLLQDMIMFTEITGLPINDVIKMKFSRF